MGATEPIWSDWRPTLSNLSSGWGKKEISAPLSWDACPGKKPPRSCQFQVHILLTEYCRVYHMYGTSQKLCENKNVSYELWSTSLPHLLRCKEPPMHKQHCRLSPATRTLKPLRRPSNWSSPLQHFIRLFSLIVHVVYCRTWYVCRVEKKQLTDISPGRTRRI